MTDDRPIRPDPLASSISAMHALALWLALRGQPDDLAAAALLREHAGELRSLWWRTPPEIRLP